MSNKKSRANRDKIPLNYKFLQILHRGLGGLSFFGQIGQNVAFSAGVHQGIRGRRLSIGRSTPSA